MATRHHRAGTGQPRSSDPADDQAATPPAVIPGRHCGVPAAPRPEPIAVVGIGCRVPGATGPEEFWREVRAGGDHVTSIPPDRFDVRAFASTLDEDGRPLLTSPFGGFIDGVEEFDAEFFTVSPYEAARMDPQQRLFLQTAWEAVEDAGLAPRDLAGSRTGVYTAHLALPYWAKLHQAGVWDVHAMAGAKSQGNMPARLAHVLDLRGPTVAVDATCSSSLMAVHLACQAMRLGDIEAAVVGGVNLILGPEENVILDQGTLLSPSGRCRFGDAGADGFVRAEAVAVVVLKPLARALADGDRVYSVILGSGAANDGAHTQFLTPSVTGQQEMLRAAYRAAGVSPLDVDYVEAHGVGTKVGDYVELTALGSVFGEGREPERPLLVGSAKTNFGHSEPAAGLVGLIKTSLALHHREIPATLHVEKLNPEVDWDAGCLRPNVRLIPWPGDAPTPVAGVNSFGVSGSNVHVVLSAAPAPEPVARRADLPAIPHAFLLPFSARSARALPDLAQGYAGQLAAADGPETVSGICYSAGARRAHHRFRGAVVGSSAEALTEQLLRTRAENASPKLDSPRIVYVFPGLGAQWTGMARDLAAQYPPFARALERYDAAVRAESGWSVLELLASDDPLVDVGLSQPAVWAVECALAEVWNGWGVTPDALIGHSMGEIAAATISGALSVADAAAVICRRSALMRRTAGRGAMVAVGLPVEQASTLAAGSRPQLQVAVCNSPASTVLAGDIAALELLERRYEGTDVFCRRLRVDTAAHSDAMDPLLDELVGELAGLRPTEGRCPIYSTVYDREVRGGELDARYWADNLRRPVRFDQAVRRELDRGEPVLFIEMSPHPLLAHDLRECIDHAGAAAEVVTSLRRGDPGLAGLLAALGQAYMHGAEPDWEAVAGPAEFHAPPRYPWQRTVFGADDPEPNIPAGLVSGVGRRPMLAPGERHTGVPHARTPALEHTDPQHLPSELDLVRRLREEVGRVLSADPDALDPDLPVTGFGLDSLLAMELKRKVRRRLGLELPLRAVLRGDTIKELAAQSLLPAAHGAG